MDASMERGMDVAWPSAYAHRIAGLERIPCLDHKINRDGTTLGEYLYKIAAETGRVVRRGSKVE